MWTSTLLRVLGKEEFFHSFEAAFDYTDFLISHIQRSKNDKTDCDRTYFFLSKDVIFCFNWLKYLSVKLPNLSFECYAFNEEENLFAYAMGNNGSVSVDISDQFDSDIVNKFKENYVDMVGEEVREEDIDFYDDFEKYKLHLRINPGKMLPESYQNY